MAVLACGSHELRLLRLQPQGSAAFVAASRAAAGAAAVGSDRGGEGGGGGEAGAEAAVAARRKRGLALAGPVRPRALPQTAKRVKFSEQPEPPQLPQAGGGAASAAAVASAAGGPGSGPGGAAAAGAAAAGGGGAADFLKRVPSNDLPPASELFAAFLRAAPPPQAPSKPAGPATALATTATAATPQTPAAWGGLLHLGLDAALGAADSDDSDDEGAKAKRGGSSSQGLAANYSAAPASVAVEAASGAEMEAWLGFFAKQLAAK